MRWSPCLDHSSWRFTCPSHLGHLGALRWGLVPGWTKPGTPLDHYRMFNARSETVEEKGVSCHPVAGRLPPAPSCRAACQLSTGQCAGVFNRLLKSHRCVVLLNGFYECAASLRCCSRSVQVPRAVALRHPRCAGAGGTRSAHARLLGRRPMLGRALSTSSLDIVLMSSNCA